jgi:FMN phosphatase YigB (HAD superfamily)
MTVNRVVILLDVDNTLLDNDHIVTDFMRHLEREFGSERAERCFAIFRELRDELGYADYLGTLQRYRIVYPHDPHLLTVSNYFVDYPFANRLFPRSLDAVEHVRKWGTTVLLTDGDVVFQPRKVQRSGLYEAVEGNVLIYIHKEQNLAHVAERYPAEHYILIDDKLRILTAVKKTWGSRVTTVFVQQGHYARDPQVLATCPAADVTIERIDPLLNYDLQPLLDAGKARHPDSGEKC